MTRLYQKNQLAFALVWIGIYVFGASAADWLSITLGVPKIMTLLFHIILAAVILFWIARNGLLKEYGLCLRKLPIWCYIPLAIIASVNFWFGLRMNMIPTEALLYAGSMLLVGIIEELIFRGFLFRAMEKDGESAAAAVSSITFGLGHIINLFNASSAGLLDTACQVVSAVAIGYLFVTIFRRGFGLIPCIICHSFINITSAFANEAAMSGWVNIAVSLAVSVVALAGAGALNLVKKD